MPRVQRDCAAALVARSPLPPAEREREGDGCSDFLLMRAPRIEQKPPAGEERAPSWGRKHRAQLCWRGRGQGRFWDCTLSAAAGPVGAHVPRSPLQPQSADPGRGVRGDEMGTNPGAVQMRKEKSQPPYSTLVRVG